MITSRIASYHLQLKAGSTTCLFVLNHYLAQIKSQQHLNAFSQVYETEAIERAKQLDESIAKGEEMLPLHGVVLAIKDVISYQGKTVSAASKILENYSAIYHATVVKRLLDAGCIIIGSCNCDEFAMGSSNENSAYGPVLNAIDNTRVPGGSSGGSAVALQAGLCMASLGSDTGGSVRQPADFCGIVGLKPTYGRISRYGLIAYASSFDQIGIFAYEVSDVAKILQVISGQDEMDGTSSTEKVPDYFSELNINTEKKYRFAYLAPTLSLPGLDAEIKKSIENLFEKLKGYGHEVEAVDFDFLDHIVPTYYVLTTAEASSNLGRYDGIRYGKSEENVKLDLTDFYKTNRSNGFGKEVKRRIMLGTFVLSAGYYDAYYIQAQRVRRLIFDQTQAIFADFDAILMPVSPTTAFKLGDKSTDPLAMYLADIYTVFANLTGLPAMAVPGFTHTNGMPFGIQILSNRFKELSLHQISEMIMRLAKGSAK